jgi:exodeoxyribonuclease VIII
MEQIQPVWRPNVTNFMVDLETYATSPDAVILSIGVVRFNWNGPGFGMYQAYNINTQYERVKDISTVQWWANQGNPPTSGSLDLAFGLSKFCDSLQLNKFHPEDKIEIWSQGTDFDVVILEHALKQCKINIPWGYNAKSDLRTLKKYNSHIFLDDIVNTKKHDAVADAIYQAKVATRILNCLEDSRKGT